jgi:hypothetical protein
VEANRSATWAVAFLAGWAILRLLALIPTSAAWS